MGAIVCPAHTAPHRMEAKAHTAAFHVLRPKFILTLSATRAHPTTRLQLRPALCVCPRNSLPLTMASHLSLAHLMALGESTPLQLAPSL